MKCVSCACWAALVLLPAFADNNADLPTAAKQLLAKMEAAVIQAKKRAVSELTSVANTESRAGKAESAKAVNAKIKELNEELLLLENKPTSKKGEEFLAGTWLTHNGVKVVLEKDNTFSAAIGNFNWKGTWRTEKNALVVDANLYVDTYELPAKKETRDGRPVWRIRGKNSKGEAIYMDKQD